MPSIWFKTSNCKIPHRFFRFFQTISDKNYGKNCYFDNFVFLPPSPTWYCWETISKSCVELCYWLATLYRGRGAIWNTLFKIPIIFFTGCSITIISFWNCWKGLSRKQPVAGLHQKSLTKTIFWTWLQKHSLFGKGCKKHKFG